MSGPIPKATNGRVINEHDFIYKNNFKNRVWSYLRGNPELNYQGYRRKSKDMQCREDVFDEVATDIKLFGIWDPKQLCIVPKTPSAIERIEALTHKEEPHKELPPSSPMPVTPENPIGNQLAMSNIPRPRKRLDTELKEIARGEFKAKPTITFEELQSKINWPEFTKFNYYAMRSDMIREGEIDIPLHTLGAGRKPSGEIMLARSHLMGMKIDEMRKMTYPLYKEKFGNHACDAKGFLRAVNWAIGQRSEKAQAKATNAVTTPVAAIAKPSTPVVMAAKATPDEEEITATPALPANTVVIMATIVIPASVPSEHHLAIKEMWANYFDERLTKFGKKNNIKCVLLSDPACIEIRKPVN